MPNEKSIKVEEMLLIHPFRTVTKEISMNDYREIINGNIESAINILSKPESGMLVYEYFKGDIETVFRIQKIDSAKFAFWDVHKDELSIIEPFEVLTKLYEHMPYVSMVGTEKAIDVRKELSSRSLL